MRIAKAFCLLITAGALSLSGCKNNASSVQDHAEVSSAATASATPAPSAAVAQLSASYLANCALCHGDDGKGLIGPNLSGEELALFSNKVRLGVDGVMPAFSAADYTDQDLKADFFKITGKPVN